MNCANVVEQPSPAGTLSLQREAARPVSAINGSGAQSNGNGHHHSFFGGEKGRVGSALKLAFDVLVSGLLLILIAPTMLVIALLIRMDGGPAMFAHERIGAGGRRFKCLKFRTMVTNSAAMLQEALERDPALAAEWAANQKLRNDPRVTRVGDFLRRTSLDELPQLINVLRLEMSLVGPRPIVSDEVRRYEQDIKFYYATRPGLTGLWQVSGRSNTTFERRVELDSQYVKTWSFWQDLVILGKTVGVVLKRSGAH